MKETEAKLLDAERTAAQLSLERDQLQLSVTNWAHAVAARDERLKELGGQLQTVANDRNDAVAKYNTLAEKYDGVVNELNARTKEFNILVEHFNKLAQTASKASQ